MSHQIPAYLNYISSITIVDGGSGYNSAVPPTITISGGGGSGATATASVLNGEVHTINITNIGKDYTSLPTITVTDGGGSGAVLTAVLGFASSSASEYEEKSALNVKFSLPEFIQTDYNKFVSFIEKYFEYMDENNNPINLLLNKKYSDIDDLNDVELNQRANELAAAFPQLIETDRKLLLKRIKNIYESKGSERSIKAYFKLLYNEEVDVYYPSKNILRASDGVWIQEKSVRALVGYDDYEVLNLNGRVADIKYFETTGSVTLTKTIPITIPRVEKISKTFPQTYEVIIELPPGITDIPGPGAQAIVTATVSGGSVTGFTVVNGGYDYTVAPDVIVYDSNGGYGALGRAVVSGGEITNIILLEGGTGYTSPASITVSLDSSNYRTVIVERGATTAAANVRAYLDRTLFSVTSSAYIGDDAGFSVGDVFFINEAGADVGAYAISGYFLENYTYIGGANNAVIRVASVNEYNVPTAWTLINPGEGFINSRTTIQIESKTGETLNIELVTKYLYSYDGKYKDDRGKLSDVNRIQDNYKFQSYSYIIKSAVSQKKWVKRFKELMHPAGMQVFGDLIISHNVNFAPFISIEADGLHLYEFKTEDIAISNDDTISIVVQWVREFSDETQSVNDTPSLEAGKNVLEIASVSDDIVRDYAVEGYFLEDYTYSGIADSTKSIEKVLTDISIPSELLERVVDYNRVFTDSGSAAETLSFNMSADLGNQIVVTDDFTYDIFIAHILSDTAHTDDAELFSLSLDREFIDDDATHNEFVSINTEKGLVEAQTASESNVITLQKPFTETGNIADSGVITIQEYSDPTYFSEDYVGAGFNF